MSEAASLCLSAESPRCYAVYRPCDSSAAAPHHFLTLLEHLRATPSLSLEARRVAEVLIDLLSKPPHPQHPSPWDLTREEVRHAKASAIAHVMEGITLGDDAVSWLVEVLQISDHPAGGDETPRQPTVMLTTAVMERLNARSPAATRRVCVDDPDGDWLLGNSPAVLSAIAAAMLRSSAEGAKGSALELMEVAALSRFSRASAAAVEGGAAVKAARDADDALPFNETVAVHCAEVAAVRGDVETVTRIIFLLYRVRGALGFATLAEHRQQRRSTPRWSVQGLLPWTPPWVRAAPRDERSSDDADARFEQAVVRLLRSVMRAVLYHPQHCGDAFNGSVEEAMALWNGLRGGTGWPGLSAMGSEFLSFLVHQHVLLTAAAVERGESPAMDGHLQRAGLHVYTHLCQTAPSRSRTAAQQEVLYHCVSMLMQLYSVSAAKQVGEPGAAAPAVPTVLTVAAAEQTLRLFAHVEEPAWQEVLLPYALAASLTLFSTAATDKYYQAPVALFSSLVRYFSEAQSLHFYCVASSKDAQLPDHVAVCGSLILLHVCLLSSAPLTFASREDDELSSFVRRISSLTVAHGDGDVQLRKEPGMLLRSWLCVSGARQRQLLWELLISLKRREPCWCSATHDTFASPASSTAVCAAIAAIHPVPSLAEMRTVMRVLYECGNTDDPVHAHATLDSVVGRCAQMPIRTITLDALTQRLQRASASGAGAAVLVMSRATLRTIVSRRDAVKNADAADGELAAVVHPLLSLLRRPVAAAPPCAVTLILTPSCLMDLQRLRKRSAEEPWSNTNLVEDLCAALSGRIAHPLLHVAVASAWPLLPSLAAARSQLRHLDAADGLREATAAARHVEQAFSKESRPVVGLWAEEESVSPPPEPGVEDRVRLLEQYGARAVSTHRAHLEKAKSDISSLLRRSTTTDPCHAKLHLSAEVAAAEMNAARRVRNKSLLRAVSQKSAGHRTL